MALPQKDYSAAGCDWLIGQLNTMAETAKAESLKSVEAEDQVSSFFHTENAADLEAAKRYLGIVAGSFRRLGAAHGRAGGDTTPNPTVR